MLANWTNGRISCRHSMPTSFLVINIVAVIATEFGVICCVGCNASCPLDEFIRLTQANIPTDWKAECNASVTGNS